jgi:hypothetical protein
MTLLQAAGYPLNAFGERGGSPGKAGEGVLNPNNCLS